jgi:hypothetical protein
MDMVLKQRYQFTSDGTAKKVNLPGGADYVRVFNKTQAATTQATGRGVMFEWYQGDTDNYAWEWKKTNSTDALNLVQATSGGFVYRSAPQQPEAAKTITSITAANPAVVTAASHGYNNGDRVVIYGSTGMLQIGGMNFTVSNVATNTFDLVGLDASGFAAPATAGYARRLPALAEVEPESLYVTEISNAASAVVTFAVAHNFVVDQLLYFSVPAEFGMVEISGQVGKITAVGTYTVTVDINSAGYSAFAFPASGDVPIAFAMAGPAGQRNAYNVSSVPFHSGQFIPYILLNAGAQSPAGSNGDVIEVMAFNGVASAQS